MAACGGDTTSSDDTREGADSTAEVAAATTEARPADPPASGPETTVRSSTTVAASAPASAPEPTVPTEPVAIRDGLMLTSGWTYETRRFDIPFTWTMPADDDLGRWRVLFDTGAYVIVTLNLADKESPEVEREEPGVAFGAVPPGLGVEDAIELWQTNAASEDHFIAEQSSGAFLGADTAVVRGTYDLENPNRGAIFLRLSDGFTVPVAPGSRRYLSYFVPVGDRTVMISINGDAIDFDLVVTLAGQLLDSLEFA